MHVPAWSTSNRRFPGRRVSRAALALAATAGYTGAAAAAADAAAVLNWTPSKMHAFGDWPVSAGPSPAVVFTLRNTGDAPATISALVKQYTYDGFLADVSAADGCRVGVTIAPGAGCTATITFDPSRLGTDLTSFEARFGPFAPAAFSTTGNGTDAAPTTPEPTTPEPTTPEPTTPEPTTPEPTTPEPTTPEPTTPEPTTPEPTTPEPTTPEPTTPEPTTPTPPPATPRPEQPAPAPPEPTRADPVVVPDLLPAPGALLPLAGRLSAAKKQVSATLAKVRYSVHGVPSTATATATLRLGGKVIGSGTLPVGKGLTDARVAVTAAARKALARRQSVRLQLVVRVTDAGATVAAKSFSVTLRRTR